MCALAAGVLQAALLAIQLRLRLADWGSYRADVKLLQHLINGCVHGLCLLFGRHPPFTRLKHTHIPPFLPAHASVRPSHLMSDTSIAPRPLLSLVTRYICCHSLPSLAIPCHPLSSLDTPCHPLSSLVISCHPLPSLAISCAIAANQTICNCLAGRYVKSTDARLEMKETGGHSLLQVLTEQSLCKRGWAGRPHHIALPACFHMAAAKHPGQHVS